jgi:hypothetical protein
VYLKEADRLKITHNRAYNLHLRNANLSAFDAKKNAEALNETHQFN